MDGERKTRWCACLGALGVVAAIGTVAWIAAPAPAAARVFVDVGVGVPFPGLYAPYPYPYY
jgi:hypothetical protein